MQYLYNQGHRRMAHLTARADPRTRRHASYQQRMDRLGLSTRGAGRRLAASLRRRDGGELFAKVLADVPDMWAGFHLQR